MIHASCLSVQVFPNWRVALGFERLITSHWLCGAPMDISNGEQFFGYDDACKFLLLHDNPNVIQRPPALYPNCHGCLVKIDTVLSYRVPFRITS